MNHAFPSRQPLRRKDDTKFVGILQDGVGWIFAVSFCFWILFGGKESAFIQSGDPELLAIVEQSLIFGLP